ncbi:hypothetical protein SCB49_01267 [unidentified eubacterium SCB49]|nr:hypothetical protein SCB49_01267 [unidentified eubacterium SCB49]
MTHFFKISAVIILTVVSVVSCKSTDDEGAAMDLKAENRKSLGASSEDILSADNYSKLRIEFLFSETTKPTIESKLLIQDFVYDRANKPGGVHIIETLIPAPTNETFSLDDIREIEDEYRTQYTEEDDIAVSVYFANGHSENDTETSVTLGSAYQNTSIVVYSDTLQEFINGTGDVSLADLEVLTTTHEFGHLFGLVNISDDDIHTEGHEDTEHSKHCVVEDCLMYYASSATRAAIKTRFENRGVESIPELDALCLADLVAKGGK